MDGVILFADDKIHTRSHENKLFNALKAELPVVGVHSRELAKKAVSSIGTFSAIIFDWQFEEENEDFDDIYAELGELGILKPSSKIDQTFDFLIKNDFYSLVYIYSDRNIEQEQYGNKLKDLYGERIKFSLKTNISKTKREKNRILRDIEHWKNKNAHLSIPLLWSSSINRHTQKIFKELSSTDKNWIKYIYDAAKSDGVSPELFVLDIFQYLLGEKIIEDKELVSAIRDYASKGIQGNENPESVARLFQKLFYTKISNDSPFMTGDICKIDETTFGIVTSPECDIREIKEINGQFDFLIFKLTDFDEYLKNTYTYEKVNFEAVNSNDKGKKRLGVISGLFNNGVLKKHFLPSLPIHNTTNKSILIDFSKDSRKINCQEAINYERNYKLNSPFIQQLRQRYIAYFGRVGVPALPEIVRLHNLK